METIPIEVQKYIEDTFSHISKREGKVQSISEYGGAIFIHFKKNRTYKVNISLYNSVAVEDKT